MAGLTITELRKRENFQLLFDRISAGVDMPLTPSKKKLLGRETVRIVPEPNLLEGLQKAIQDPENVDLNSVLPNYIFNTNVLLLPAEDVSKPIPSGYLQKTPKFGGSSQELVYQREGKEHYNLNASLRKATLFGILPIKLIVETINRQVFIYDKIVKVQPAPKVNGNRAKADFEFLDKEDNIVFRISHKHGSRAVHFRQWSGVKEFETHPEFEDFSKTLKEYLGKNYGNIDLFPPTLSVGRKIKDDFLKRNAIFGQNVDFLVQGRCEFEKVELLTYRLKSNLILARNESIDILPEPYQPILLARRGDTQRHSFGIKGCRGTVYPAAGRKIDVHI